MTVRLAFSMAIQVEADVVLVDEVLAVGDAGFQRKCYAQFDRLRSEGRTVLFVTHDMDALKRHCDRVLLLEEGRVADIGDPEAIARRYEEVNESAVDAGARRDDAAAPDLAPSRQSERPAFAGAGRPATYRPSALGGSLRRFFSLTGTLARADLQMHYEDSVLGYLWSILRPLTLFAVLYLVFADAADLGRGVNDYPVYLLCAIVMWTFFTETTGGGVTSLVGNAALLRRMRFPRLVIPAAVVVKGGLNLVLELRGRGDRRSDRAGGAAAHLARAAAADAGAGPLRLGVRDGAVGAASSGCATPSSCGPSPSSCCSSAHRSSTSLRATRSRSRGSWTSAR